MLLWNFFRSSFKGICLKLHPRLHLNENNNGGWQDERGYKEFICAADTNEVECRKVFTKKNFLTVTYRKINCELKQWKPKLWK